MADRGQSAELSATWHAKLPDGQISKKLSRFLVIPGRRKAASPESIATIVSMDSGLAPSKRRAPE
jgi:hypothetical protein